MEPFPVYRPAWMRIANHTIREELPDYIRFCEMCGRSHDDVDDTWQQVTDLQVVVLPPEGPCLLAGTVGTGMAACRVAPRFDYLLLDADILGTLDERPVCFLVETHLVYT
ncbi:hypothetical protein Bbelb_292750 [Branchiostoma belcheri]|nr:hypothetical protein Bbelb_292750 [Branchiostoma belcheri]